MKLKATIIFKSDYNGKSEDIKEILQGFKEFLEERIDLSDYEIIMGVDDGE